MVKYNTGGNLPKGKINPLIEKIKHFKQKPLPQKF